MLVPGDDEGALAAAAAAGAEAVVVDLSDPVPGEAKAQARWTLDAWLRTGTVPTGDVWVRINGGDLLEDDVQVVLCHDIAGIWVPAATDAGLLVELDHILGARRAVLCPVIETAVGLLNSGGLAAVDRVSHLAIGEGPLGRELGLDPSADEVELASVRGHLVVISAAFAKRPPIGSAPRPDCAPDDVLASSERLRRLGYAGRAVLDPNHVALVHDVWGRA